MCSSDLSSVPAAQHAGGAIQRHRVGIVKHPQGQIVGRADVGQQPGPCQNAGLTGYRGGAQHRESAAGPLPRSRRHQFGAARARRAADGQHAAAAIGSTVKHAPDLGHLAAAPRKNHT